MISEWVTCKAFFQQEPAAAKRIPLVLPLLRWLPENDFEPLAVPVIAAPIEEARQEVNPQHFAKQVSTE